MVETRQIGRDDLERLRDLDMSEDGHAVWEQCGGELRRVPQEWHRPHWDDAECARRMDTVRGRLDAGDIALGAFDADRLIGLAVLQPELEPQLACLRALWISASHRRRGVGRALVGRVDALAREAGSRRIYVSSTPSESAVAFYRSQGFEPTVDVNQEMVDLEPDDIHMIKGYEDAPNPR
jgi:GNAT superfamily N-acetyltransferase